MIETTLVKRKAKYAGEIGLFGVEQIADKDLSKLPIDEIVWAN